jgi:branched-chain amino acid transport system substrate-binding protein
LAAPARLAAQGDEPIRLGGLLSLTGGGAAYGPQMAAIHRAVIQQVNDAGGVLGHRIDYFLEDDQTSPDAAVLAAHKLIDVDRVAVVMGLWASAVAAPVLPVCWDNKVMALGIASSDSLVDLPTQGYFVRTQPHTALQGARFAEFAIKHDTRHLYLLAPQQPYTEPVFKAITAIAAAKGIAVSSLIYDIRKTSYRSEAEQVVAAQPDLLFLGGYAADNTILLKDLFRANYGGAMMGFASGITDQLVSGAGKQVTEGIYTLVPEPALGSTAYANVQKITGKPDVDTYSCQSYDHVNLALLAMAHAHAMSGTAVRDDIRAISNGPGQTVSSALEGLKLLAAGQAIDYEGASGPCHFEPNGNISDCAFQLRQIRDGRFVDLAG